MKSSDHTGKKTILLVDDEQTLRYILNMILVSEGYIVVLAENGKQAVDIYKANPDSIDLVLMDIMMPIMSGVVAHKELTAYDPTVLILLMSGSPKESIEDLEHFHFIKKPMFHADLLNKINQIFTIQSRH